MREQGRGRGAGACQPRRRGCARRLRLARAARAGASPWPISAAVLSHQLVTPVVPAAPVAASEPPRRSAPCSCGDRPTHAWRRTSWPIGVRDADIRQPDWLGLATRRPGPRCLLPRRPRPPDTARAPSAIATHVWAETAPWRSSVCGIHAELRLLQLVAVADRGRPRSTRWSRTFSVSAYPISPPVHDSAVASVIPCSIMTDWMPAASATRAGSSSELASRSSAVVIALLSDLAGVFCRRRSGSGQEYPAAGFAAAAERADFKAIERHGQ